MRNWNVAKIFSYKEIKTATNNFKEVIGHGSFGSVYLGKLPEGKLVAVKVRFDKTQLGADSFINEVGSVIFPPWNNQQFVHTYTRSSESFAC